jgi:hypothetical protein
MFILISIYTIFTSSYFSFKTAFEAILNGSWQPVELIKIESGKTSIKFMDIEQFQSPLSSNIRVKSRKATAYDCSGFLRPGIDIAMLLGYCYNDNPDQFGPIPVSSFVLI